MKTVLIALILTGFASLAFAVEGLTPVKTSPKEKALLKEYAEGSRNALQTALDDAAGKSRKEQIEIYKDVIIEVVKNSYNKSRGGELLMRFILNQALQLTVGDSSRNIEGILTETFNPDIVNLIYSDSIKLAIQYSDEDIKTIQKRNFAFDYNNMAFARLDFIRNWSRSILDIDLKSRFLRAGLEHWHTTVAQPQNLGKAALAVQILKAEEALKKVNGYLNSASKERFLNGVIEKVLKIGEEQRRKEEHRSNNTAGSPSMASFITACNHPRNEDDSKKYCLAKLKKHPRVVHTPKSSEKIKMCAYMNFTVTFGNPGNGVKACLDLVFYNPKIDIDKIRACGADQKMTAKEQEACHKALMSNPHINTDSIKACNHPRNEDDSKKYCLTKLKAHPRIVHTPNISKKIEMCAYMNFTVTFGNPGNGVKACLDLVFYNPKIDIDKVEACGADQKMSRAGQEVCHKALMSNPNIDTDSIKACSHMSNSELEITCLEALK